MGDAANPGSLERSAGNIPNAAGRRESRMRRVGLQEELAVIRCWTAALKICGDGGADIGRQRHDRRLPSLALNTEMARSPVDIIELEGRSEGHTSELQSLMRISYAGFSLNTKTQL